MLVCLRSRHGAKASSTIAVPWLYPRHFVKTRAVILRPRGGSIYQIPELVRHQILQQHIRRTRESLVVCLEERVANIADAFLELDLGHFPPPSPVSVTGPVM